MGKTIAISLPDWVVTEIIGETKNRSQRIEELIIKGYMASLQEKGKKEQENELNLFTTRNLDHLPYFLKFPKYST
jgi:hypothetical protein